MRNVTTTRLQLAFETLYGSYCVTERPKMIYNESTKQFVLIGTLTARCTITIS